MLKANPASVPRSEKALGRADCLASDVVGDIVRIRASKIGNRFQVEKIDISDPTHPPAVGVITRKLGSTDCIVQFHGPLRDIYSGLFPGTILYVGTDGRPAYPSDPNYPPPRGVLQQLGVATSSDEVYVNFMPPGLVAGLTSNRYGVRLIRVDDRTWRTPEFFEEASIRVYHNGRRLERAPSSLTPLDGCFYVSESGGAGAGFDTVNLLRFSANARSLLLADYVAVM